MAALKPLQPLSYALLFAVSGACGSSGWTLDVNVRVSDRRQKEFTEYPAQLVLVTDLSARAIIEGPDGYAERIANLCSARAEDFTLQIQLKGEDCAQLPRYVAVWMERREPDAEAKCGQFDEPSPLVGLRRPTGDALEAEASVFVDYDPTSDCDGMHDAVSLALDW